MNNLEPVADISIFLCDWSDDIAICVFQIVTFLAWIRASITDEKTEHWRWRRRTAEATVDLIQIARGAETRWSILMGEKTEEDGFPGGVLARTTDCWQWGNPSRNALPVNPCLLAGFLHPPSPICCCSAGYTGRVNGYFALLLAGAVYSAMGIGHRY
jgi:hypothetical protein